MQHLAPAQLIDDPGVHFAGMKSSQSSEDFVSSESKAKKKVVKISRERRSNSRTLKAAAAESSSRNRSGHGRHGRRTGNRWGKTKQNFTVVSDAKSSEHLQQYASESTRLRHEKTRRQLQQAKRDALKVLKTVDEFNKHSREVRDEVKAHAERLSRRRLSRRISRSEFKAKARMLHEIADSICSKTARQAVDRAIEKAQ